MTAKERKEVYDMLCHNVHLQHLEIDRLRKRIEELESENARGEWHEWSENPTEGGGYLILLTNTWSRALGIAVGTYDWIHEEWTFYQDKDETPRYWMKIPKLPEVEG